MSETVKSLTIKEYEKIKKEKEKEIPKLLEEMKDFSKDFLTENFNIELNIPIQINGRLSSTLGRYLSRCFLGQTIPISIELSKKYLITNLIAGDIEEIYDTLKHELVHYALSVQGKDYSDGSHDFEMKLYELNISSSGRTPTHKKLSKRKMKCYKSYKVYQGDNNEKFIFASGKSYYKTSHIKSYKYGIYKGSLTHVGYEIKEIIL